MQKYSVLDKWPEGGMTSLQGQMDVSFNNLVQIFGEPQTPAHDKSDAEWYIMFEDGLFATIYNYKDGVNYNGVSGTPTTKIRDWHIGGKSKEAYERVSNLIIGKM